MGLVVSPLKKREKAAREFISNTSPPYFLLFFRSGVCPVFCE